MALNSTQPKRRFGDAFPYRSISSTNENGDDVVSGAV